MATAPRTTRDDEQPRIQIQGTALVRAQKGGTAPNGEAYDHRFIASTDRLATDGGVIPLRAWHLDKFMRRPRWISCHDIYSQSAPITQVTLGRVVCAQVEDGFQRDQVGPTGKALVEYVRYLSLPFAQEVKIAYEEGGLDDVSVRWDPRTERVRAPSEQEIRSHGDDLRWVAEYVEQLELSAVLLGADGGAQHAPRSVNPKLIEAFERVRSGGGAQLPELEKMIRRIELQNRVMVAVNDFVTSATTSAAGQTEMFTVDASRFSEDQPRDPDGKFASTGGGKDGGGDSGAKASTEAWNKALDKAPAHPYSWSKAAPSSPADAKAATAAWNKALDKAEGSAKGGSSDGPAYPKAGESWSAKDFAQKYKLEEDDAEKVAKIAAIKPESEEQAKEFWSKADKFMSMALKNEKGSEDYYYFKAKSEAYAQAAEKHGRLDGLDRSTLGQVTRERGVRTVDVARFDESKIERGPDGKFAPNGGSDDEDTNNGGESSYPGVSNNTWKSFEAAASGVGGSFKPEVVGSSVIGEVELVPFKEVWSGAVAESFLDAVDDPDGDEAYALAKGGSNPQLRPAAFAALMKVPEIKAAYSKAEKEYTKAGKQQVKDKATMSDAAYSAKYYNGRSDDTRYSDDQPRDETGKFAPKGGGDEDGGEGEGSGGGGTNITVNVNQGGDAGAEHDDEEYKGRGRGRRRRPRAYGVRNVDVAAVQSVMAQLSANMDALDAVLAAIGPVRQQLDESVTQIANLLQASVELATSNAEGEAAEAKDEEQPEGEEAAADPNAKPGEEGAPGEGKAPGEGMEDAAGHTEDADDAAEAEAEGDADDAPVDEDGDGKDDKTGLTININAAGGAPAGKAKEKPADKASEAPPEDPKKKKVKRDDEELVIDWDAIFAPEPPKPAYRFDLGGLLKS